MTIERDYPPTLGLILAGGQSSRMGGTDKSATHLGGMPLLRHVANRLHPQCMELALNAPDGTHQDFAGVRIPDRRAGFQGPLAGIETGLSWMTQARPRLQWLISAPADCPFLPKDLAARLHSARSNGDNRIAVASSGGRLHHAAALWSVDVLPEIGAYLDKGDRKLALFFERHAYARVDWSDAPIDPFFNVNRPEDLSAAEEMLVQLG